MTGACLNGVRRGRGLRGNNLIEFAMVLPILLTMFMGVFDFGWILHQQISMDNATREGARRGAIGATDAQIKTRVQGMCEWVVNPSQIIITVQDPNGVNKSAGSRTPGDTIIVNITRNNVALVTPIAQMVETIGTINMVSEARFIIE